MKPLCLSLAAALPACAASQGGPMDEFKRQAQTISPVNRAIAASDTFFFCKAHPEADRFDALCEICNVDLYADKDLPFNADPDTDAPIVGVKGWATHFYHEYKPRDGDPNPRIAVTGEHASQKFTTRDLRSDAIEALFADANAWCQARGEGEFRVLKNEIETFVGGLPQ